MREFYHSAVFGANGQDGFYMARYLLKKQKKTLLVSRRKTKEIENLKNKYKKFAKILIIKNFDLKNFHNILKKKDIDKIYFFAGYSKIPENQNEKKKCLLANYTIFKYLLSSCVNLGYNSKILYLSSGEIFGSNQKTKKKEKSVLKAENYYSECKIKTYNLIKKFRKKNKLFIVNAICYNHESIFTPQNHVIRKFIDNFEKNDVVKIYNPEEFRNISHIIDFLPLFSKVLDKSKPEDYIFANNENISIKKISLIINKFYNKKIIFKSNNKSISRMANNLKIKKDFNYCPIFNTEKILIRMVTYHRKNFFLR